MPQGSLGTRGGLPQSTLNPLPRTQNRSLARALPPLTPPGSHPGAHRGEAGRRHHGVHVCPGPEVPCCETPSPLPSLGYSLPHTLLWDRATPLHPCTQGRV